MEFIMEIGKKKNIGGANSILATTTSTREKIAKQCVHEDKQIKSTDHIKYCNLNQFILKLTKKLEEMHAGSENQLKLHELLLK